MNNSPWQFNQNEQLTGHWEFGKQIFLQAFSSLHQKHCVWKEKKSIIITISVSFWYRFGKYSTYNSHHHRHHIIICGWCCCWAAQICCQTHAHKPSCSVWWQTVAQAAIFAALSSRIGNNVPMRLLPPPSVTDRYVVLLYVCAQSYPTLCDPMDYSPPGSSVHGILRARILEWVAMLSSRGSSRPRDQTHVFCISCNGRWILHHLSHCASLADSWQLYGALNDGFACLTAGTNPPYNLLPQGCPGFRPSAGFGWYHIFAWLLSLSFSESLTPSC